MAVIVLYVAPSLVIIVSGQLTQLQQIVYVKSSHLLSQQEQVLKKTAEKMN